MSSGTGRPGAVQCEEVWKSFRLPYDRPRTIKQRVLHPRQSRAAKRLDALRDVSFDVERGEFFGVIGRNGSGKSTLLKCLAGIYQPTRGRVSVAGRLSPFIELGVGFIPELTALDNIVVNASLVGIPPSVARQRFDEIMQFAELEEFADLKLKNYSSGMYVRLGFAAAIQADADVYLVDEVLAVGDARFQEKCFDTFRRLKRQGRTVVFVTHDLGSVERFCDRALLLERGRIGSIGDPIEVTRMYLQHILEEEQADRAYSVDPETGRWGDGAAEIIEAWFEDASGLRQRTLPQHEAATLSVRIRFHRPLDNPVFGVILKNERGDHVVVTNTVFDGLKTGGFQPGDEAVYSVTFELHLGDGRYTASPAVAYQDTSRFADWREEALSFLVRGERYTGSVADLPHESRVERTETATPQRTEASI
jgi:ABC-type polysaccharide/polyol phosphate transport system ATPase subunit